MHWLLLVLVFGLSMDLRHGMKVVAVHLNTIRKKLNLIRKMLPSAVRLGITVGL